MVAVGVLDQIKSYLWISLFDYTSVYKKMNFAYEQKIYSTFYWTFQVLRNIFLLQMIEI